MVAHAQPISTQQGMIAATQPSRRVAPVIVVAGAGFGARHSARHAGAVVPLRTAVFFEMLASGIAACF